jgi:hypothetical protein
MQQTKIKWATPPAKRTGTRSGGRKLGATARFVEVLKTRPNKWAIYKSNANNAVTVSTAKKAYPQTEWTSRKNPDGTFTLYARFIGKQ